VFLKNEAGAVAANAVLQDHLNANLAVRGDRARIVVELLTSREVTHDQLKEVPHRELMSALALMGVNNFKLGSLKGDERRDKIIELVMAFRKTPEAKVLMAEQYALVSVAEETTTEDDAEEEEKEVTPPKTNGKAKVAEVKTAPNGETPKAVVENDFIIAGKEWYRVLSIKKSVIFTEHNKSGIKKAFKQPQLKFTSFTARKHTPTWEVV
jgi:hypothetical protein